MSLVPFIMEREKIEVDRTSWERYEDRAFKKGTGHRSVPSYFTMFVGNLPEEMDEEWMHQVFSGAGEVQDVYIPKKRSIFQNQKFGFVRYESKGEGFRAINLWNSATIRDHKLLVKFARFSDRKGHSAHVDKEKGSVHEHNHSIQPRFAETSNQGGEMQ